MSSGFVFDGVHSDAFSLIVNKKSVPMTPPIESRLQKISGFDGAWDYGTSYAPKPIEIECTILADSNEDLKSKIRKLAGKLNPRKGAKPLIFDDESDKQYFARLSNQIPLEQLGAFGTFTLQFICADPFTYAIDLRTGTFGNFINLTHNGMYVSKPILTVTHGGGSATITNDRISEMIEFTSDSPSGEYVIDCKEMTITLDGAAGYNFVEGDFIYLEEGDNYLENVGAISSVDIEFYDTWL